MAQPQREKGIAANEQRQTEGQQQGCAKPRSPHQ